MKIGLALGGGAVFGFAHIGVIKVLEKEGIRPDIITGTSVGSLIGGLYASGVSIGEIEDIAEKFNWFEIARFTLPKQGLVSIDRLVDFVEKHSKCKNIEETKIKFAAVAVNLLKGEEEIFDSGPMGPAIRASCSIPGIFTPALYNNSVYIDGGILNNVPTDIAKKMGADYLIGVDITARAKMDIMKHRDIFNILWKSWQISAHQSTSLRSYNEAGVILMPDIREINPFDTSQKKKIIAAGEESARQHLKVISRAVSKKKRSLWGRLKKVFRKEQGN